MFAKTLIVANMDNGRSTMNWKRGLLRAWLLMTGLWLALIVVFFRPYVEVQTYWKFREPNRGKWRRVSKPTLQRLLNIGQPFRNARYGDNEKIAYKEVSILS